MHPKPTHTPQTTQLIKAPLWIGFQIGGCFDCFSASGDNKDLLSCMDHAYSHSPTGLSLSSQQTMEYSGVPSVTLIVGCGLSCLALITLAVIYAILWR